MNERKLPESFIPAKWLDSYWAAKPLLLARLHDDVVRLYITNCLVYPTIAGLRAMFEPMGIAVSDFPEG